MKRSKNAIGYLLFILLTTVGVPVSAAAKPAMEKTPWTAQEIRLVDKPDEIIAILENGMAAIVKENHTAPVAAVRLYVRAGSIYESPHLGAGISHLFEHLLAGGATKNRSEEDSRKLIEKIGARYNAFTGKGQSCYYLTVPAQHVGEALSLIADWVTRPTFPEESFNREWGVVQRELEMNATDPDHQLWNIFDELRYKESPARYPIVGYQSVLKQLTRQEILEYYRLRYIPDNCVIVIVGDIHAAEMLGAIKKEFTDFTRRAVTETVLPQEPAITAPRQIIKVCEAMRGPAKMIMGFPSFKLQHRDLYALDTVANILGEGKSSRLYQSLRENKQLVYSITAADYTPTWADGTFMIICELDPNKIEKTQQAIRQEITRLQTEGVTDEELNRAKRQLQVGHIRSHQTAEQQAETLGPDYLGTGDAHFSDQYVEKMQQVTADKVQEAAKKYLTAEKELILVLTGKALTGAGVKEQAKPAESAIKKITLENGLRVLIKRNAAVPLVNVQMYLLGGLLDETEADNGITNLMTQMSTKGTAKYTAKEIVDYFDGIGGTIAAGCGNNTFFYQAEFMPQDWTKAFDIFSEVVLAPSFPAEELAKLKPQVLARIEQIKNSWPAEGERFFREKFFANSPYKRVTIGRKDSVATIDSPQLKKYHEECVQSQRAVLAVFGDIDIDAVEAIVREKFAPMPSSGQAYNLERFTTDPAITTPRQFVEKTDKTGATVHVGFAGMTMKDVDDRYRMEVLTQIVGSNTGWLHELLRGQKLVYYAWGYNFPGLVGGYIAATAQCEPDKAPEVIKLIQEQLAKAAKGDISEDEIARAKSQRVNSEILDKQTNADMAMTAALDELYGFGYQWSERNADRIMAITKEDVHKVAQKYLSTPPTVTVNTSQPQLFESEKK